MITRPPVVRTGEYDIPLEYNKVFHRTISEFEILTKNSLHSSKVNFLLVSLNVIYGSLAGENLLLFLL